MVKRKPDECDACRFYAEKGVKQGECLRFPPTLIDAEQPRRWPQVRATEWCGEFARK